MKKMKKDQTINLGIAGIIIALILGGSFIMVQNNKQASIERQTNLKIEQENKVLADEKAVKDKEIADKAFKAKQLGWCEDTAEDDYWEYMRINMDYETDAGIIWADTWVWDKADEDKQQAIDNCFKKFR